MHGQNGRSPELYVARGDSARLLPGVAYDAIWLAKRCSLAPRVILSVFDLLNEDDWLGTSYFIHSGACLFYQRFPQ